MRFFDGRLTSLLVLSVSALGCSGEGARSNAAAVPVAAPAGATSAAAGKSPVSAPVGGGAAGLAAMAGTSGSAGGSAGSGGSDGLVASADDADAGAPGIGARQADSGAAQADSGAEAPATACPVMAMTAGETRATLQHGDRQREYLIYVPRGYDNTRPVPLVLNFHGASMTAEQQRDFSGMNATADANGFVVVYPQGVGNTWNAGACCGEAQSSNVDDVGFARALVEAVQKSVCIDARRVYSAGFSNGGRMSYRLGCELAQMFAAIAPVAGTKSFPDDMNTEGCKPSQPISLIDIMGSADPRSAAQPGQIAEWVALNGCSDASPTESYRNGQHFCSTYSQCKDATSVTFCMVEDGDHCWPGSYPCFLGNTSRPEELSANDLMWQLFERSMR